MLLYRGLRHLLKIALELYYLDIQVVGTNRIPSDGPVIFAANHPNSIMDTVILGTQTKRQIHYMARSGLFGNPLLSALFSQCGVIPVYRAEDHPDMASRNDVTFAKAFETLEAGRSIGIFPEGGNADERRIKTFKTGTARIALGAEARNNFELGVHIVPVGLNFVSRARFLSGVLVRFGEPIPIKEWQARYAADERQAVRDLTENLQERVQELAVHIENDAALELVKDIKAIYGRRLIKELQAEEKRPRGLARWFLNEVKATPEGGAENLHSKFWLKQRIADAIQYYQEHEPERVDRVRRKIQRYKDHLAQYDLREDFFVRAHEASSARLESIRLTLYTLFFALPAGWGFVWNAVPYSIARMASNRAYNEQARAIVGFGFAFLLFPLFYTLWGWLALSYTHSWWLSSLFLASLLPSGFFFLRYRRRIVLFRKQIMARTLLLTKKGLMRTLIWERAKLLHELDELRTFFMNADDGRFRDVLADTDERPKVNNHEGLPV